MKNILDKVINGIEEGMAVLDHIGMPQELYNEVTGENFISELGKYREYSAFDDPNLLFGVRTIAGHVVVMVYDKDWGKLRTMVEKFPEDPDPKYIAVSPEDVDDFLLSLIRIS